MLQLPNDAHEMEIGLTRYGKSYDAKVKFLAHNGPAVFFNPRKVMVAGSVGFDRNASTGQVMKALKRNEKLNYSLDPHLDQARKDIDKFVELLFERSWTMGKMVLLVFDEAQDYAPQGDIKNGLLRVARTGLGENIKANFIVQRPADISKIIVSQCEIMNFFQPGNEDMKWIEEKKYPLQDILARIDGRKYYKVVYYKGELGEAKKINYRGEL